MTWSCVYNSTEGCNIGFAVHWWHGSGHQKIQTPLLQSRMWNEIVADQSVHQPEGMPVSERRVQGVERPRGGTWSRLNAARYRCTQSVCHVDLHCPVPFFHRQLCTVFRIQTRTWRSQVMLRESLDIPNFPFGPSHSYCSSKFRKSVLYLRCIWFKCGPSTCYIDRFLCLSLCVTVLA